MRTVRNRFLEARTARDIDAQVSKIFRGLGNPTSAIELADVRDLLELDRQARPADEYRTVTQPEWLGFEEHFDQRKVELGGCARPYGTPCQHEHACLRCPMININPKMLPRLNEIEDDLQARRSRATHEGWLGEIEGIDLTLTFLRQKRDQTRRLARIAPTDLGMPGVLSAASP